eukprot:gnl/TRDRNA2_/TRDRNA2_172759_c0_seq10.p2 gnl/TRDRNA2_/TRDRNA2_172759_c0~~gnl/TRDRNA2_/TRDRNA2_172759_c0_seq10.p2  ORF type:complete len:214 (-),score=16.53 gnl/TRDRNA2_/TRDRNA2_172759_c0_seq10:402-1043(-)
MDSRLTVVRDNSRRSGPSGVRPTTLAMLQALKSAAVKKGTNESKCKWFAAVDVDSYLNLDALVEQLRHYDSNQKYFLGALIPVAKSFIAWTNGYYGTWTNGALGHVLSRGLLTTLNVPKCFDDAQQFLRSGKHMSGHDDMEVGGCIHRQAPDTNLVNLRAYIYTQEHTENRIVRAWVDGKQNRSLQGLESAHRMTPQLNKELTKMLHELSTKA